MKLKIYQSTLTIHFSAHPRISSSKECVVHMELLDPLRPQDSSIGSTTFTVYLENRSSLRK